MVILDERSVDLRIRRTKKMLQEAFISLMIEKRFTEITVQDITERAMVNRGTFYDHFSDKHALMEYALREWFRQMLSTRLPDDFGFSPENLGLIILTTCEFLHNIQHHCAAGERDQFPMSLQTQITTIVQEILLGWFRAGHPANQCQAADLAASVASWGIYGAALHWSQSDGNESANAFVARVLPVILASVNRPA